MWGNTLVSSFLAFLWSKEGNSKKKKKVQTWMEQQNRLDLGAEYWGVVPFWLPSSSQNRMELKTMGRA